MSAPFRSERRFRMCDKKRRYSDENTARAAGQRSLEHENNPKKFLWTYRCDFCEGYHLTRSPKIEQAAIHMENPYVDAGSQLDIKSKMQQYAL